MLDVRLYSIFWNIWNRLMKNENEKIFLYSNDLSFSVNALGQSLRNVVLILTVPALSTN